MIPYPETPRIPKVFEYHGQQIVDDYYWLEDDRSPATKAWVNAQNKVTYRYLDQIPYREALKMRLESLWNYEKYSMPFQRGKYTYYFKNSGLQNHAVLFRQEPEGQPQVFLDPNTFSKDGTTSLASIHFSKDGSKAAYLVSEGGADWRTVHVIDTEAPDHILETLQHIKFSGVSWNSNQGFFYSRYELPKEDSALSGKTSQHQLFYHQLGTPQENDQLIYGGAAIPRRYIQGYVTENQRWLVILGAQTTTGNELLVVDLKSDHWSPQRVVEDFECQHEVVWATDTHLYIQTTLKAPNGRLVCVPIENLSNWITLIPEQPEPLTITTGSNRLFAHYLKDAISVVKQYSLDGQLEREINLPGQGTVYGFNGLQEQQTLHFQFTNYIQPSSIYTYQPSTGETGVFRQPGLDFDATKYHSYQVFYESQDGTRIPMMITHRKDLELNGKNPCYLYGYGGFKVSLTPYFSVSNAVWLEYGGILAIPNLRGGGEYGDQWHLEGTKMNKQNVFDDFVAAAQYLIKKGFTNAEYLALSGGSNGGLLVGAVMTQFPELAKVALPAVGVLDMLRYHTFTAGAGWAYDYGTAEDSPEMFAYLKNYSPYHRIEDGKSYPATLVTTGDHDDRVVPAHSFKFAARLQAAQRGEMPILIRIEISAGHGAGKPTKMIIAEQADKWAFTFWNMGYLHLEKTQNENLPS